MNETEVKPQEVRAHLDRVMASKIFAESDRLRRFLRFTVESRLNERDARVKEYVLGREVFDRDADYDPRLDPIVRVEARRLRAKLEEYYSGPGREEPIRFEYARGSYLPSFSRARKKSVRDLAKGKLWPIYTTIVVIAIAAIASYFMVHAPRNSMVATLPARWIEPNPGDLDKADAGLAEAVNSELANRQIARVLAWPVILQYRNHRGDLQALAKEMGVGKILLIIVRDAPESKRVTVFLVDSATGQKLRAQSYLRRELSTLAAQRTLAGQIAGDLAKTLQTRD
jgi:TolB-like protein